VLKGVSGGSGDGAIMVSYKPNEGSPLIVGEFVAHDSSHLVGAADER
jgi:hypothetical protein